MANNLTKIFKSGSRTYFYSSLFFPKKIRHEVTVLYAFVRVADDYVDSIPQQKKEFLAFKKAFNRAWQGEKANNQVIDEFVALAKEKNFKKEWLDAFFAAMEADTHKTTYENIEEVEDYIYGSAEVVGLMMAEIMSLPKESLPGAQRLGKSMQYINFIRDLAEDIKLNRQYLPGEDLKIFHLESLDENQVLNNKEAYLDFINYQLERYFRWQKEAEAAFRFLPLRYLIPIKTASLMYNYTAQKIKNDPSIVFKKKVKPAIGLIIKTGFAVTFNALWKKYLTNTKV